MIVQLQHHGEEKRFGKLFERDHPEGQQARQWKAAG
jgi:hypothetical protein